MKDQQYTINIDQRPIRAVFLIPSNHAIDDEIDKIIKYNVYNWGGRFNQLIIYDGNHLSDEWFTILQGFDPDVIKSLIKLDNNTVNKINNYLSPYSIEAPDKVNSKEQLAPGIFNNPGINIPPVEPNILNLIHRISSFTINPKFVLFDIDDAEESVKRFIEYNFGAYAKREHNKIRLDNLAVLNIKLTTIDSLSQALNSLGSPYEYFYPIQLASLPNYLPDVEYLEDNQIFQIVAGDSIKDIAHFWNCSLLIQDWKRVHINKLWVSEELAKDARLRESLKKFIRLMADPGGSTLAKVKFISSSIRKKELDKIRQGLTGKQFYISKKASYQPKPIVPKFKNSSSYLARENISLPTIYARNGVENINLSGSPTKGIGHWILDIKIKYKPNYARNYIGKDFWVKLPRKNQLTEWIVSKSNNSRSPISRINSEGYVSTLVENNDSTLAISFPKEDNLIQSCFTRKHEAYYRHDPRNQIKSKYFYHTSFSVPGRYLHGITELITITYAYQLLSERFWRKVFNLLSTKKEVNKFKDVQELIIQELNKKLTKGSIKKTNLEYWSHEIFKMARDLAFESGELTFEAFRKEAETETKEYNRDHGNGNSITFDENDLKGVLNDLVEGGILQIGIKPKCSKCSQREWTHIDMAMQIIKCTGCANEFSIPVESVWFYRLNSLVRKGIIEGIVPIILVLGHLLEQSKESFMYSAPFDLYKSHKDLQLHNKKKNKPFSELDIACIVDGKLVIGEVKLSNRFLKEKDFRNLEEIAKISRPDFVFLTTLENKSTSTIQDRINKLQKKLKRYNTKVLWYQLPEYMFTPTTIR